MASPQLQAELGHRLRVRLAGEIYLDPYQRSLYSTDASNHRIEPIAVVVPRTEEDLFAILETAAELGVPLIPRGGGTSLSGSAIGAGLVIDCSQHLAQIHHLDPEAQIAEVGPGLVCAELNRAAGAHGLLYGPDPASADRATVGGMVGTNATGAHSIRYGMTADHVVALDVILADGSPARLEEVGLARARQIAARKGSEGRIYQQTLNARSRYAEAVRERWPRTWRRSSGYSLNYLTGFTPNQPAAWPGSAPYPPASEFNLAPLLCGSEGTLALVRRAQLRLVPRPKATALVVLAFSGVAEACDFTPAILETEPAAVELIPRTLIQRARAVPAYSRKLGFVQGDPAALLVVEYTGESPAGAQAAARPLAGRAMLLSRPEEQADLWTVRKAGLGLLMSVPGPAKPITFMEDVAVPVEQLGAYVREVDRLLTANDTYGEWYAHASAGCLHLRPLIDLKSASGIQRMRSISEAVVELTLRMGGAISGEHGDGVSHTEFNERLFGPVLLAAFRELKQAFDPKGILNPGKVVPAAGGSPARLDAQLRFGPAYRTQAPNTQFAFRAEGGFAGAVEACTGVGICRKADGVMCPSFQATRMEMHSTRGRANALRAAISGALPREALTGHELYQILDLCLECKGCKAECPTQVDMARLKAEVLNWHQAAHGVPLRSRFFGELAMFLSLARRAAGLANWLGGTAALRWGLERTLGIDRRRVLPRLARHPFSGRQGRSQDQTAGEPVVLFVDTFTRFNHPELGSMAVKVLEAAGCRVLTVEGQACCGRTMISKGLLDRARAAARRNVAALAEYVRQGIPVIGLEPSCLLTLRDEYLDLLPDAEDARILAAHAKLIEEYLTEPIGAGSSRMASLALGAPTGRVLLHNHCHSKALVGSGPALALLRGLSLEVEEIPSGCCGMAGSFGYEVEHYPLSMQIGELTLFPWIRRAREREPGLRIAAPGMSCRAQIRDGTGAEAVHPLALLAEGLLS